MGGYKVIGRDEWGGDKATQAISAWRNAEEAKAQRLLQERSWLAQQALLRGDIGRYSALTGVNPTAANPNYDPEVDKMAESTLSKVQDTVKEYKEGKTALSTQAGMGTKLVAGKKKGEMDAVDSYSSKPQQDKRLADWFDTQVKGVESIRASNPKFFTGTEFGKNANILMQGYLRDRANNVDERTLMQKYGVALANLSQAYGRNVGNPYGVFAPAPTAKRQSGGPVKQWTGRIGNERIDIETGVVTTARQRAEAIKRTYPELYGTWSLEKIMANMKLNPGITVDTGQNTNLANNLQTGSSVPGFDQQRLEDTVGMPLDQFSQNMYRDNIGRSNSNTASSKSYNPDKPW